MTKNVDQEEMSGPLWTKATLADVDGFNFEAPLKDVSIVTGYEIASQYRSMSDASKKSGGKEREVRVFDMLSAVAGMYFRPNEPQEPYGPMSVLADGRRSAIPSDFRGHVGPLANMAERATNVALKARLSDLSWMLERKRSSMASSAIEAYLELAKKLDSGDLKRRREYKEKGFIGPDIRDYLRRALQIGRAIGWEKPETLAARNLGTAFRKKALSRGILIPINWFSLLDLDFGLSDSASVAVDLECYLEKVPANSDAHGVVDLWRLAARGYHDAKRADDEYRCQSEAAERLVAEASLVTQSPIMAATFLSDAISTLSGVPGKRERRTALRHQLVDTQAHVVEEMSTFSHPLDLTEIVEGIQKALTGQNLRDKLFILAGSSRSPAPEKLVQQAKKSIAQHPLASLLGTSYFDREGKVVHRSNAARASDDDDSAAIRQQIAQAENIRRTLVAHGTIEPARHIIVAEHLISDDVFSELLRLSPFVPEHLLATFSRGLCRLFQGDFVSALYVLTPLLENSLRHVLKSYGHDVSIFDDSTKTQQDRTISSLLEQMRPQLDEIFGSAIVGDIERVFIEKPGPVLRHSLAHGLLQDGDPYGADAVYGCWLIFQLCLMPLFPYRSKISLAADA